MDKGSFFDGILICHFPGAAGIDRRLRNRSAEHTFLSEVMVIKTADNGNSHEMPDLRIANDILIPAKK
jgi:hypothetical protein